MVKSANILLFNVTRVNISDVRDLLSVELLNQVKIMFNDFN